MVSIPTGVDLRLISVDGLKDRSTLRARKRGAWQARENA